MKKISTPKSRDDTPRTNELVREMQSTPIPFQIAYWRLLELTRNLEIENNQLKERKKVVSNKNKPPVAKEKMRRWD
jgi:hypothetical protein